jgi:hypothetical protein
MAGMAAGNCHGIFILRHRDFDKLYARERANLASDQESEMSLTKAQALRLLRCGTLIPPMHPNAEGKNPASGDKRIYVSEGIFQRVTGVRPAAELSDELRGEFYKSFCPGVKAVYPDMNRNVVDIAIYREDKENLEKLAGMTFHEVQQFPPNNEQRSGTSHPRTFAELLKQAEGPVFTSRNPVPGR